METLFEQFPQEIAAVIVEPVAANMGLVSAEERDFSKGCAASARNTERCSSLMRSSQASGSDYEGAQGYFGVDADLVTYGKIIGAGMPVGAYGGRRDDHVHGSSGQVRSTRQEP